MSDPSQIADLITEGVRGTQGPKDSAYHTGIVRTWDNLTGANQIEVNGVILSNLRTLRAGITSQYNPGETVVLLRKQTQYFILGRVAGVSAGGCSGIQTAVNANTHNYPQNLTPFYPTSGVTVQSYLSSGARALVIAKCKATVYQNTGLAFGIQFTLPNGTVLPMNGGPLGASDDLNLAAGAPGDFIDASISIFYTCNPGDGFIPGLTEFKTMCAVGDGSGIGSGVDIINCTLVVIPL